MKFENEGKSEALFLTKGKRCVMLSIDLLARIVNDFEQQDLIL